MLSNSQPELSVFVEAAIAQINHALKDGWRSFHPAIELAVGTLTARELHQVWSSDRTHPDFLPYMWAFHVSWSFEGTWAGLLDDPPKTPAEIEAAKDLEIPDNFNPDIQLRSVPLFAPQDHLDRVYRG